MSGRHLCGSDVPRRRADDYGTVERAYAGDVADTAPGLLWQEFVQPIRAPAVVSDVVVPLLQAAVSAIIVWIVGMATVYIIWWFISGGELPPFHVAAKIGGFVALLVLATMWFRGMTHSTRTQSQVERRESAPPPPPIPEPVKADQPRISVKLEIVREDGVDYMDLPLAPDKLKTMARALKAGRPFSVNSLTGAGAPLSRGEFMTMRDEFMERGYMVWKDEQNRTLGVEFTDAGMALLDELAALP